MLSNTCQFIGFQSSPDLWAGCYDYWSRWFLSVRKFQSSPDLWAGCYELDRPDHPGGGHEMFQSSPDLWAGCYPSWARRGRQMPAQFQSSPDLWAGCYHGRRTGGARRRPSVSILTRPMGRVLHRWKPVFAPELISFQSSPDLWAGCYLLRQCSHSTRLHLFQSSPDLWAGCYPVLSACMPRLITCFNPHPTYGPGATFIKPVDSVSPIVFQSSPDLWAGCYLRRVCSRVARTGEFQSSPDLWAGCYDN